MSAFHPIAVSRLASPDAQKKTIRQRAQRQRLRGAGQTRIRMSMNSRPSNQCRPWLLGILAGAVSMNLAFLSREEFPEPPAEPTEVPQFVLEPLNYNGILGGYRSDEPLPFYDGRSWTVGGASVGQLREYILDTSLWDGPHTFGKIMVFELPPTGSNEDVRRSIEALSAHGICRIAVFDRSAPVEQQGLATAVQVRSFVDRIGQSRRCYDMINGGTWTITQAGPFLKYLQS